jgi:large subunit ribosomal protein L21
VQLYRAETVQLHLPLSLVADRPQKHTTATENVVYAIINTGGHQVKVAPGATVTIDRVEREVGDEMSFTDVLLIEKDGGEIVTGTPGVTGARVVGVVEGESRGPKIRVFKKKRRKGMRRTKGHRSTFTLVRITEIQA